MADPATDTTYPGSIDLLPHVPPNARENDPGLEHDVVHTRANAVLNALMQIVGTVDDTDPLSILGRLLQLEEGGGGGSGDVVGPASAGENRIAVFDGTTGKAIKDGGYTIGDLRALALTTPENVQTGTSYTLVLSDAFKLVCMDNAAANVLTVPPNSVVPFPVGVRIDLSQDGAGQTTIAAGSGVSIRTPETLKLRKQRAKATLIKRGADTWDIEGNLEAAP